MADVEFSVVDATSATAQWAMGEYLKELSERFPEGVDSAGAIDEAASTLNPPHGFFAIAGSFHSPSGCGGVHFLDSERGEIKRMWVAPESRGQGVATSILGYLEDKIRESGRTIALLDTNRVLTNAIALYERCGYQPTPRYNDNPYAHFWFRKDLKPLPD